VQGALLVAGRPAGPPSGAIPDSGSCVVCSLFRFCRSLFVVVPSVTSYLLIALLLDTNLLPVSSSAMLGRLCNAVLLLLARGV
jgi:hypothetical protein